MRLARHTRYGGFVYWPLQWSKRVGERYLLQLSRGEYDNIVRQQAALWGYAGTGPFSETAACALLADHVSSLLPANT